MVSINAVVVTISYSNYLSWASSATIYAPQNMISTLIGKGGENVRQLQDELGGMQLNIESFDEMPESLSMPKNKPALVVISPTNEISAESKSTPSSYIFI